MINCKKILLFVITLGVLFLFMSCAKEVTVENCNFNFEDLKYEVSFEDEILPNDKIAKQYADLILENSLQKDLSDYKITNVKLDPENGVWVIYYGVDAETLGGDINIALSRKNGEVLKIWFGE